MCKIIERKMNHIHPMKAAWSAALCWVFFIVQRKDKPSRGKPRRTYSPDGVGRLPGKPERNAVPRKGDNMAMARAGNGFLILRPDNLYFLYIPQFLPRGLRYFFVRHISINFIFNTLKNTMFLLRAYRAFCRCVFFVP